MHRLLIAASLLALLFGAAPALAQGGTPIILPGGCGTGSAPQSMAYLTVDSTLKLCVNATVNATVGGFQPNGAYGTLTATAASSASTALPTGATVRITNLGSSAIVSCTFATGAATGLVSNLTIPPLFSVSRVIGSFDHIACIDQTGSTGSNLVVLEGGSGLGNDSGGTAGGSGSGATNITQVGGVNVPTGGGLQSGALPVDASTSSQIHADLTGPVTACAATPCVTTIGRVGIDNTVPGTTNGVTDVAAPLGGASSSYLQPTASDNHANIKNGAGTAYSIHTSNNSATKNYLRLYDAGTGFNGCNSATGIIFGMEIPPSDSGFSVILGGSKGLAFSTGLSICVTSGYGATDTTNATPTAVMSNVIYK